MRFTVTIQALVALAMSTAVLSVSLPHTGAREARSIENVKPVVWRGEINGEAYEHTGTAEEVWAKLKERHPEMQLTPRGKERDLEARAVLNKELPPLCIPVAGQDWNFASQPAIDDGISYLINLNTRINIDGTSCGRISCSYNSAIYLCNDNDYSINPASAYLASYASDLEAYCSHEIWTYFFVGGQEFDSDGYNIIVRSDSC